jgi:hypothetical protein
MQRKYKEASPIKVLSTRHKLNQDNIGSSNITTKEILISQLWICDCWSNNDQPLSRIFGCVGGMKQVSEQRYLVQVSAFAI